MSMLKSEIKAGVSYSSPRWKGDRKVSSIETVKGTSVVYFIDLRTARTGSSPLDLFAKNATGQGLVSNV